MDDIRYLRIAYDLARQSPDPSTQNAALLVHPYSGLVLAGAFNQFPAGVLQSEERWASPAKYDYVEHAERAAIYGAAAMGLSTTGLVMYCPWFACADCARAIIGSGVREVVGHAHPLHRERADWADTIKVADAMLAEAGVKARRVAADLGVEFLFGGKTVQG